MNKNLTSHLGLSCCIAGLVAFAAACGTPANNNNDNNSNTNDGGPGAGMDAGPGADAGPSAGMDAGPGADAGPPPTYCDGFAVQDSSSDTIDVQTFGFGGTLKTEACNSTIEAYTDGTSLTDVTGVFDLDTSDNGGGTPAPAIFVSNCSDLGLSGFTPPAATAIVPPTGALTVAAAYGSTAASVTVYGVVTAVYPWGTDPDTTPASPTAGNIYIQDATSGTPAAMSGSEIYFTKTYEATYGTPPAVGDVVAVTAVKWSPYEMVNQFEATATTTVTNLGTSPLPTPVSITGANASLASYVSSSGYEGMRVTVSGGPFTVHGSQSSNTCPAALQYTPSSGG